MKKGVTILICLVMIVSTCLSVNASGLPKIIKPTLPGSGTITQPTLPGSDATIQPATPDSNSPNIDATLKPKLPGVTAPQIKFPGATLPPIKGDLVVPDIKQPIEIKTPTNLSIKLTSENKVSLSWQDKSDNEEGFLLYKTAAGEWEVAAKLNANVTTYTDKTIKPNTKYFYILYAYAGEIVSKESNIAEVTTPSEVAPAPSIDFTGASIWALEELKKAVEYDLYTERIMKNYSQNITREEFCELMIKLYEKLKGTAAISVSQNPFRDTMNESILKAYAAGIVNGTSKDAFSPNNTITRQDICVMLYRAITSAVSNVDASISGVSAFADENMIGNWAVKEVKFAYKKNIMKGSDNKIMPKDNTNREQALLLVKRVYEAFAIR